jgi:putative SbcD/Mre11-related phosphoesterase
MNQSNIQPILNETALLIEDKEIIVISDLHIGIENELRELGLNTPSQTSSMAERLISILKKYSPKKIILLGDIKHNIPVSTINERFDVKQFLSEIIDFGLIHVIPGNHDGNIHRLLSSEIQLHSSDGFVIDDIGFIHGHTWPNEEVMKCNNIVIGHTHPTIMLTDRLGYKTYEQCWIKGECLKETIQKKYPKSKNPEIIVVPAFNPLCGGIAVNKETIIGPFKKILDVKNSEVYLPDGSSLGKVKNIK